MCSGRIIIWWDNRVTWPSALLSLIADYAYMRRRFCPSFIRKAICVGQINKFLNQTHNCVNLWAYKAAMLIGQSTDWPAAHPFEPGGYVLIRKLNVLCLNKIAATNFRIQMQPMATETHWIWIDSSQNIIATIDFHISICLYLPPPPLSLSQQLCSLPCHCHCRWQLLLQRRASRNVRRTNQIERERESCSTALFYRTANKVDSI